MNIDNTARLLITCQDKPGIIAAVTAFLTEHQANITDSDQHSTDPSGGKFFMRLEFQTPDLDISASKLEQTFAETIAKPFNMDWHISYAKNFTRMGILVSKHDHALLELLWRYSRKELPIEIPFVISNHPDLKRAVENFDIDFYHVEVEKDNKANAEQQILQICQNKVDGLVLARYMQVLSHDFVNYFPNKIINIHHSFLPAFVGASPYKQAFDKGVKLIGATAHYVTEDLDQGPIITQNVVSVSHRHSVEQLVRLGKDVERNALFNAVKYHAEDRIIVDGNKTIVFGK